jgi:hypothetical protein
MIFLGSGASKPLGYMVTADMKKHLAKELESKHSNLSTIRNIFNMRYDDVEYLYYSLLSLNDYLSDSVNSFLFQNLVRNHNLVPRIMINRLKIFARKPRINIMTVLNMMILMLWFSRDSVTHMRDEFYI